jgi:hypothetical protein
MATDDPGSLIGIHLTTPEIDPPGEPVTDAERAYVAADIRMFSRRSDGYGQAAGGGTKPGLPGASAPVA